MASQTERAPEHNLPDLKKATASQLSGLGQFTHGEAEKAKIDNETDKEVKLSREQLQDLGEADREQHAAHPMSEEEAYQLMMLPKEEYFSNKMQNLHKIPFSIDGFQEEIGYDYYEIEKEIAAEVEKYLTELVLEVPEEI